MKDLIEKWCKWFYSISKDTHPAITGNTDINQTDPWFLVGSFGNIKLIKRKCVIPYGKSIFFPVLSKEDSFAEDTDLKTESELVERCNTHMDSIISMDVIVDNVKIKPQRMCSDVFDLVYPLNNVYDVPAGKTRSVVDGYWVLLKLPVGSHEIHFTGICTSETAVIKQERQMEVFKEIWPVIEDNMFCLNILYDLKVIQL